MAKILHTADFHLDSAFTALPEEKARLRRQEARQLTDRLVDYANDHGVELLLLAGDLFDSDQLYGQTAQELARSLARFRGHAVIAPGNHDFYAASSPYARLLWPENVHIFREERLQRLPFPQYGCVVYGAAFTAPAAPAGIPGSLGPEDEGLARILLLHGEVGVRDSRYRAMTLKDVEQSGADYLALGHVHAFGGVQQAGRTFWAYPGCPEGRGFDELGDKGFLTGTVEPGQVKLTFAPFARRRYQWLTVDVTGVDPLEALRRELPPHPEADIFRMVLTGETEEPPEYDYAATRAAVDQIDDKVRRIRHAQHAFNATAEVPGEGMTVDEALVALAQMNAKLAVLARLRSAQAKKRVGQGWGNTQGVIEYEYANYDVERAAADYAELFQCIADMQLNIDLVNQTQTFEVEL